MNRRAFLEMTLGLAFTAPFISCSERTGSKRIDKPNLLVLWTDEQRPDTMAAYGNNKIQTTNLNKFTRDCVVFRNAYVAQPVCTPDRSTVMTGLWPHQSGCTKNNIPLPKDIPCLPEIVNDPDYHTGYMGKWHLGDEIFAQHGFREWVSIEDTYSDYYTKDKDPSERSSYHHYLVDQGYSPGSDNKFSRRFAAGLPLEHSKAMFLQRQAREFLNRQAKTRQPFILYVNFLRPHMPFTGPLDNMYDPAQVTLPPSFHDPMEEDVPLRYRVKRQYLIDKYGASEQDFRSLIARYWGLVTQVDMAVGKILDTLAETGLDENTMVVYTSDHGDMMGAHHMAEKSVMYQEAVKIPLLMRIPWLHHRQISVTNPVSQIDLVPTILDVMGVEQDMTLPGQSLLPAVKGQSLAEDHVFIEWNPDSGALKIPPGGTDLATKEELARVEEESTRAVITPEGWKLCLSDYEKSQLYNLQKDPGETTNLYYSNDNTEIKTRLTDKILTWQNAVRDSVLLS